MFNHSCRPNCQYSGVGDVQQVRGQRWLRAVRPDRIRERCVRRARQVRCVARVREGEELFVQVREDRQRECTK